MALPSRLRALPRHLSSLHSPSVSHFRLAASTCPSQTRFYTQHLSQRVQIYRSTSADPYLNLSIEHHLLQRSHPDSTILFLYANRPSVVIGRNQNPWLEVNLHALRQGLLSQQEEPANTSTSTTDSAQPKSKPASTTPTPIALVRRRSGGGTVFHDAGNTNWSVICPPANFDRDTHAEMVVRALRRLGVSGVRVNERHDIVMDTPSGEGTFKVSGSAYKLTRTRSLHHGTCLLASANLGHVSGLLRSPAEGFIKARGVESVRSPIRNVGVDGDAFAEAVVGEFRRMYGEGAAAAGGGEEGGVVVVGEEEALREGEVVKGVRELTNPEWIFGQTPQFTFSTHPTEEDPRERPGLGRILPHDLHAQFTVRHGEIQSADIAGLQYHDFVDEASQDAILSQALVKQRLHHIGDWRNALKEASPVPVDADNVGEWLNHMFGIHTSTPQGSGAVADAVVQSISDTPLGAFLNRDNVDL